MLKLLRGALLIATLLCLLSAIMIVVGNRRPVHPMLAGIGECENRPCWYGIAPGITTAGEANAIIGGLIRAHGGYWSEDEYQGEGGVSGFGEVALHYAVGLVEGLRLSPYPDLPLGEALSLFDRGAAEVTWNCFGDYVLMQQWWTLDAGTLDLSSAARLQIDAYVHMPVYPLYGTRWQGIYALYAAEELGDPGCG